MPAYPETYADVLGILLEADQTPDKDERNQLLDVYGDALRTARRQDGKGLTLKELIEIEAGMAEDAGVTCVTFLQGFQVFLYKEIAAVQKALRSI